MSERCVSRVGPEREGYVRPSTPESGCARDGLEHPEALTSDWG